MINPISPLAGRLAPTSILINVQQLVDAYYTQIPDPQNPNQRVIFGTSGHRGSSLEKSFNESHILAISQAICFYRQVHQITGPLFIGFDTHALSEPAFKTAVEVFAANSVEIMLAKNNEYTPTPVISHAVLTYNRERASGLADGIVITPSHDPPHDGGFKYNSVNGGPADLKITEWIEKKANHILENNLKDVKRIHFEKAIDASTTHYHDYLNSYVNDLVHVIDMDLIRNSRIHMGVDPLGGAGVHYWPVIAERYKINLTIINKKVDPRFQFMTVDWDGQIRMDPSSKYAMESLIELKNQFDIAFACDTDHDRHGIVTPSQGLMPANQYLSTAVYYLLQHREKWQTTAGIGKTIVSSQMIDRVSQKMGRKIDEVPVGFKWFVDGLLDGSLVFCGEESAGATFSRLNGKVWTTDKDGMVSALLSAEITAKTGQDPSQIYHELEKELGKSSYLRIDAKANPAQKKKLKQLSPSDIHFTEVAGEKIQSILSHAPGNDAPIGGIKVITNNAWFAARPSGTENIYRLYAESFKGPEHLHKIVEEAQTLIAQVLEDNKT